MNHEQPLLAPTQNPEQVRQAQEEFTANQRNLIEQAKAKAQERGSLQVGCAKLTGRNDNRVHEQTKEAVTGFLGGILLGAIIGAIIT